MQERERKCKREAVQTLDTGSYCAHYKTENTLKVCVWLFEVAEVVKNLKGSYDAILKIIIWCNRICWHALMFKNHIIIPILYIIVGPLCPASLKRLIFNKDHPSDKRSLLWLANWHSALWLAEHHKPLWKCNAPFHNRELQLAKWK